MMKSVSLMRKHDTVSTGPRPSLLVLFQWPVALQAYSLVKPTPPLPPLLKQPTFSIGASPVLKPERKTAVWKQKKVLTSKK